MGIAGEGVRSQVLEIIGSGQQTPEGQSPFTPRAKKVLELSLRESSQLGHNHIGTEHILLGLIREGDGVAAQVLTRLGADLHRVRQQVLQLLADAPDTPPHTEHQHSEHTLPDLAARLAALEQLLSDAQTMLAEHGRQLDELAARMDHGFTAILRRLDGE